MLKLNGYISLNAKTHWLC